MSALTSHGFAARLALARAQLDLTCDELGGFADLHPTDVRRLERGEHAPSIETCERLAIALDLDPAWLAYGTGRAPSWAGDSEAPAPLELEP